MDKIWDRNPSKSEVIGRCGGDEKRMTTQNRQMSNAKKKSYSKVLRQNQLVTIVIHRFQVVLVVSSRNKPLQ